MTTRTKQPPAPYRVDFIRYKPDEYATEIERHAVARFYAEGDAIAYTIHRAHSLPSGDPAVVFEVYRQDRKIYRAG